VKVSPVSNELVLSGQEILGLLKDVQNRGGSLRLTAKGDSMKPTIRNGDTISIAPVPVHGVGKGDIVLFRKWEKTQITVHRIININGRNYLVRGDNAEEDDGWISDEMIKGVVTGLDRKGKILSIPGRRYFIFYKSYLYMRKKVVRLVWYLKGKKG